MRLGVWQMLLLAGWLEQKLLCSLGLPSDCASDCTRQEAATRDPSCHGSAAAPGMVGEMEGLQQLFMYGLVSGWFCAVDEPARFGYLFGPQRVCGCSGPPWFPFLFLAVVPLFTLLTTLPLFEHSLSSNSGGAPLGYMVTLGLLAVSVFALIMLHIVLAAREFDGICKRRFWTAFFLPVGCVYGFFGIYLAVLIPAVTHGGNDGSFHLHHWWVIRQLLDERGCKRQFLKLWLLDE